MARLSVHSLRIEDHGNENPVDDTIEYYDYEFPVDFNSLQEAYDWANSTGATDLEDKFSEAVAQDFSSFNLTYA